MKITRLLLTWLFFGFSIFYLANATALRWGTSLSPGAGVFPVLVGIILMILTLIMAIRASISKEGGESPFPKGRESSRVLGMFGSLVFYTIALPILGHPVSSAICFGVILKVMGMRQWGRVLLGGGSAAIISWYLFGILLEIPLPLMPLLGL